MTIDQHKLDSLVNVAVSDLSAGYGGVMISLGDKLGLYKAMAGTGALSASELARRSGCAERYVREWLNSQAAGGYVQYHPADETYELSAEQALVLADDTSPVFVPSAWQVPASMWFDEAMALQAFRTGAGVAWGNHDARLHRGSAAFYRNAYQASLVSEWLPALEGVEETLRRGTDVADVGCGHGHSTVILAKAFPRSRFWGFDVHEGSIVEARRIAEAAGVSERVRFSIAESTNYPPREYGLICFFDCLHDMGRPDAAALHARSTLAADGSVMVVEPFAHDRVEENFNPVGRLYYAASTTLCCPHAVSEDGSNVLGAQAGEARLTEIFRTAGYTRIQRVAQTPFNLILQAHA